LHSPWSSAKNAVGTPDRRVLGRDSEAGAAPAEHTHSRPSRALHPTDKTCIPYPEETLRNG